MIRLRLIGTLDLRTSNGAELRAILAQPRRFALLAYLAAASPRGFHRRDAILALFWPDQEQSRARASLNRALYFLRHELGDGILVSRGDEEIGLDTSRFCCDVADLEDALENGQWREALELYRGDLLPGFFVSDSAGFEDWLERERTRLREGVSDAAWTCAEQAERASNFTLAAHWARRSLELAPFHEVAVRRLLSLLDRAGDRAGAAHAYDRFAHEIAAELDLAPSPETRALIDTIRARTEKRAEPASELPNAVPAYSRQLLQLQPRVRSRFTRRAAVLGLSVTALGITLVTARTLLARGETVDPGRVDVMTFENLTGDPSLDNLARTATDRVIGGLGQTGLFKSIRPRDPHTSGALRSLWARLAQAGRATPASGSVIVSGMLVRESGRVHLRAVLREAHSGGQVWEVPPIAVLSVAPEGAIDEIRDRVVGGIAAMRHSHFARVIPHATPPPSFDAYQEFEEAFKLAQSGHSAEAVQRYRVAAALDSTFTWAIVQAVFTEMFNVRRSPNVPQVDSLLASLARARTHLPVLQRHLLDYLMAARRADWPAAHDAMRLAADLAPLAYSYALAIQAMNLNRPRENVEVLTRPGVDSVHRGDALNYWYMLTLGYHMLGEYKNELDAAKRARANRPDSPRALSHAIRALAALGRIHDVRALLDTVLALPREGWFTAADAMIAAAQELRGHGHHGAARDIAARAIAWDMARPAEERLDEGRRWHLASALYLHEDWAAADTLFRGLEAEFADNAEYIGFVGAIAARRGDRATAQRMARRLEHVDRLTPIPGQQSLMWRAKIAALLGDRETAVRLLRAAYGPQGTVEVHGDMDYEALRDYAEFREFARPKG